MKITSDYAVCIGGAWGSHWKYMLFSEFDWWLPLRFALLAWKVHQIMHEAWMRNAIRLALKIHAICPGLIVMAIQLAYYNGQHSYLLRNWFGYTMRKFSQGCDQIIKGKPCRYVRFSVTELEILVGICVDYGGKKVNSQAWGPKQTI